jgi:small basic protein
MVAEIVGVFLDALTEMVGGVSAALIDIFDTLVYNATTGLTGIATWSLVFGGIALVLGLINRFTRA